MLKSRNGTKGRHQRKHHKLHGLLQRRQLRVSGGVISRSSAVGRPPAHAMASCLAQSPSVPGCARQSKVFFMSVFLDRLQRWCFHANSGLADPDYSPILVAPRTLSPARVMAIDDSIQPSDVFMIGHFEVGFHWAYLVAWCWFCSLTSMGCFALSETHFPDVGLTLVFEEAHIQRWSLIASRALHEV